MSKLFNVVYHSTRLNGRKVFILLCAYSVSKCDYQKTIPMLRTNNLCAVKYVCIVARPMACPGHMRCWLTVVEMLAKVLTVVALPEPKHINGLVADTHSHFCDDIPDRTDRLVPI